MRHMQKRPIDIEKQPGSFIEPLPHLLQTLPSGSMRLHSLGLGLLDISEHGGLLCLDSLHLPLTSSLGLVPLCVHLFLQVCLTCLLGLSSVNL